MHEGAHQKLFDLVITHDLLDADSDRCPTFHPPWAPEGRFWPLEQTLVACHAYACFARFANDAGVTAGGRVVTASSLLLVACVRCELIGRWLDRGDHLRTDAHTLLEGLLGRWTGPPAIQLALAWIVCSPREDMALAKFPMSACPPSE